MKVISLGAEGLLLDFGRAQSTPPNRSLVYVEPGILDEESLKAVYHTGPCGGVEFYTTQKGRPAVRVREGSGYVVVVSAMAPLVGDREVVYRIASEGVQMVVWEDGVRGG